MDIDMLKQIYVYAKVVMYVGKDQLSQPTVCIDVHAAVDYFRNNVID